MVTDFTLQVVTFIHVNLGSILPVLDFLLKSFLLVVLVMYLEKIASPFFASHQRRQLWLALLILLALLPLASMFLHRVANNLPLPSDFTLVNVLAPVTATAPTEDFLYLASGWWLTVVVVYIVGLILQLTKLLLSFSETRRLEQFASYEVPSAAREVLRALCTRYEIRRHIRLGDSQLTNCPVTFGALRPTILVPSPAYYDDLALLENVLIHELSHIKRFDYLTYLAAYFLASCNWFNPFVWIALNRLNLESEFACDDEVLQSENRRTEFANQLVNIARTSLTRPGFTRLPPALATRAMLVRGQLTQRVEHILYGNCISSSRRTHSSMFPLSSLFIAFILASTGKVFAISDGESVESDDLRLIHSELPEYPEEAVEKGETGITQFSFRVNENGKIDPGSIILLYSSPQFVFEETSIAALNSFVFSPRRINGRNVPTPGVLYSFKFDIRI